MNWNWLKKRCKKCYNKNKGRKIEKDVDEFEIFLCNDHQRNYDELKLLINSKTLMRKKNAVNP